MRDELVLSSTMIEEEKKVTCRLNLLLLCLKLNVHRKSTKKHVDVIKRAPA